MQNEMFNLYEWFHAIINSGVDIGGSRATTARL